MKIAIIITFVILTTAFALNPYFNLGINLNGVFMLTIGGGYKNNDLQNGFQISFGKEENTFVIAPELYLKKTFSLVFGKINLQGIFPIGETKYLLLFGIGGGIWYNDFESSVSLNYTFPFSAVNEIKGPIPSFEFSFSKDL
jgi:hypothetical protein